MKQPEAAPDWLAAFRAIPQETIATALSRPDIKGALLRASDARYPYWDEFKYIQVPSDFKIEWLWALREFGSLGQRKLLELKDSQGQKFSFWLPDSAQQQLHSITQQAAGPLLSDGQPIHSRERYIARSLADEAIASSLIEGAATTRAAARELLREGRKPSGKAEKMIFNNHRAMERLRDLKSRPLSRELLCEVQAILTEDTLEDPSASGRFRRSPEDDDIVVEHDGTLMHKPPVGSALEASIDGLIAFANSPGEGFIHPVVKACLIHFWVAHAHPFVDGNGRTARALFYWSMLKDGFWLFEYISISNIVYRTYSQYLRAYLYTEMPGNDLTYFVMYNLRVINLAIRDTLSYIERKGAELQRANAALRRLPALNHRQRELLLHAVKNPGHHYSIRGHQNTQQITYQTARTDLLGLAKRGYMEQIKSGKVFYFIPTSKIAAALGIEL